MLATKKMQSVSWGKLRKKNSVVQYLGRVQRMQTMIDNSRKVTKAQKERMLHNLYDSVDTYIDSNLNKDEWDFQQMLRLGLSTPEASAAHQKELNDQLSTQ